MELSSEFTLYQHMLRNTLSAQFESKKIFAARETNKRTSKSEFEADIDKTTKFTKKQ